MKRPRIARATRIAIAVSVFCLIALTAEPQQQAYDIADLAHAVPLYWNWKFSPGDSPIDPTTQLPMWAQADFDDRTWQSLNLWPNVWTNYPGSADRAYIPGWTARGNAGYWGYAWYRTSVFVRLGPTSQYLAIAFPDRVEDAYQVYLNGSFLGQFGEFAKKPPRAYYSQPTRFVLYVPPSSHSYPTIYTLVFAIRIWMGPHTLSTSYQPGGLRSKPILGAEDDIELNYRRIRGDLIEAHLPLILCAAVFSSLAILAWSLVLFARSRTILLLGSALALTALTCGLRVVDLTTQMAFTMTQDRIVVQCVLQPLTHLVWLAVWALWCGRGKGPWAIAGSVLTLAHMITNLAIVVSGASMPLDLLSLAICLAFIGVLCWATLPAARRLGFEGLAVAPAIVLLSLRAIVNEVFFEQRVHTFIFFRTQFSVAQIDDVLLAAFVASLLLFRLRIAVRRNRAVELDARRAQIQSDFVAAVSHEFRSPLTTIRTIADLLTDDRLPDESRRRESFQYIGRATRRLQKLVEDLLDFGQIDAGTKHYRLVACDAFQIARTAVADFRDQPEAAGFQIDLDFSTKPAWIKADEEALRRIIRNLLENAVKYSPNHRQVWVEGAVSHKVVSISVRDRGMGIESADQRTIFQRFIRGEAAKKAGITGTGLGLAIAKQICDAMGGEIHLQSEVGLGSTFKIVFPLAKE